MVPAARLSPALDVVPLQFGGGILEYAPLVFVLAVMATLVGVSEQRRRVDEERTGLRLRLPLLAVVSLVL